MKKSIFLKIYSGFFFLTILLSGLILLSAYLEINYTYKKNITGELTAVANTLKLSVTPMFGSKELVSYAKELDKNLNERITIINSDGSVILDTQKDQAEMVNHKSRPEVAEALKGNAGSSVRFSKTLRMFMLYAAVPIRQKGEIVGVLRLSRSLSSVSALINSLEDKIVVLTVIIIIMALVFGYWIFKIIVRPIVEVKNAALRFASGDLSARVHAGIKNSETKELAEGFNKMADEIQTLVNGLADRTQKLDALISALHEGLFVFSKEGRITLANKSLKEMVSDDKCEGRFYWEYFRESVFGNIVKAAMEKRSNASGEMEFNGKTYLISVSALDSGDSVVIMMDITAPKYLEKIKKDFVANVSHELRTPLTAIKGFIETMEGDMSETNKRYLSIIKKHSERLIHIVSDLLTLSELEEKNPDEEFGEVDLNKLINDVSAVFQQRIAEKNLKLIISVPRDLPLISGDIFRLEQLFINLVDNAVKYTDKGEIHITLSRSGGNIVAVVEDTGIGIPKEHLSRVFERFYVADKGRSKKTGGTGLGLAIVKHIAMIHGGTASVESTLGAGTRFTVTLPIGQFN